MVNSLKCESLVTKAFVLFLLSPSHPSKKKPHIYMYLVGPSLMRFSYEYKWLKPAALLPAKGSINSLDINGAGPHATSRERSKLASGDTSPWASPEAQQSQRNCGTRTQSQRKEESDEGAGPPEVFRKESRERQGGVPQQWHLARAFQLCSNTGMERKSQCLLNTRK